MRPARALIDLAALRHNYHLARRLHGGRALAVVKANAYGHGAVRCAQALADEADGFAVAFLDEALELRAAGIQQPILLLEGVFAAEELADVARHGLWTAVHHEAQIEMIERTALAAPVHVWLKINSGMNRAGFLPAAVDGAWQRLRASGKVADITLMTHFARADEPQVITTEAQVSRFDAATAHLPVARSLANSGAILGWPQARRDWARPGILLYGADPMPDEGHGLWTAVHHEAQIEMIERTALAAPIHVWLKINSGMNRAGFLPAAVDGAWQRLRATGTVADITLMTHFARADEPQVITTEAQVIRFDAATAHLPGARSLANSGAILGWPQARRDWARPSILLYGADPMPDEGHGLQPVMTLESAVMAVREIAAGEALGYGARFIAERDTRVGLVAMGYADGYPRGVADGTPVAVDGLPTRIIGRVSMDMLTVDLTDLPDAGIGSGVELWGRQVPVNRVARAAGTIAYELLCNVKRVRFSYSG